MDGRTDGRTDGRPDGRSGPTTRPAFAKATQVKIKAGHRAPATHFHPCTNKFSIYFAFFNMKFSMQ